MSTAVTTKERPILFSAPMVRAILEGKKTQTRRVVKGADDIEGWTELELCPPIFRGWWSNEDESAHASEDFDCPYGNVGEWLWVRETHALLKMSDGAEVVAYRASCPDNSFNYCNEFTNNVQAVHVDKWRPSIHMPRKASPIGLEIESVRVERLQDISESDAMAEGCKESANLDYAPDDPMDDEPYTFKPGFMDLWEQINGERSWDANPWVWVLQFRKID